MHADVQAFLDSHEELRDALMASLSKERPRPLGRPGGMAHGNGGSACAATVAPPSPNVRRAGVFVASSYGIKISVRRGQLVIETAWAAAAARPSSRGLRTG